MNLGILHIRNLLSVITFCLLITGLQCQSAGKNFPYNSYLCYKTSEAIIIDGAGTESAWANADWSQSFVDIEGAFRAKPSLDTKVKMLWDEDYFYFYAELKEPHIWGTLTERDAVIFYDDDFEIFIDPDGDGHNYYEFEVNALNTLWELILLRPYRADNRPKVLNNWNIPTIKTAVSISGSLNNPKDEDEYWSVEWAIPWSALKELSGMPTPPEEGNQWRVNFSRVDWDMIIEDGQYVKKKDPNTNKSLPEHNWVWQPTGKINMHMPEEWGYVQFSDQDVADGEAKFIVDSDVYIKKYLWALYLKQLSRINAGKSAAVEISELEIQRRNISCNASAEIFNNKYGFHIEMKSCKSSVTWIINSEGRLYSRENNSTN